jgi:hypothetical protein
MTVTNPKSLTELFPTNSDTPQDFPTLLALYKAREEDSKLDLSGETDARIVPGLTIRKNGAIQALPGLYAELVRMVEQSAGAIFLSGDKQSVDEFVGLAQDLTEGAIVLVSAKEMYTNLAVGTERGLRSDRRFSMDTLNAFVDSIMKLLDVLTVDGIPAPNLTGNLNKVFPDVASLEQLMRDALASVKDQNGNSVGDGLNAIYLQQKAAEEAIRESVATPFLPVLVLDSTFEDVEGSLFKTLFFGRNLDFEATAGITEGFVRNALKKLQAQHPKAKAKK